MLKRILILIVPLILAIAACNPMTQQLPPTATVGGRRVTAPSLTSFPVTLPPTITPEFTSVPQPTPALPSIPTASPTPIYSVALYKLIQYNDANLYKFDPDILPPILVYHNPPLIAGSHETVRLAFEVHSASPPGAIALFEKTPQGYVLVSAGDQLRSVWFDPTGKILKDVTLPHNDLYSEMDVYGQYATNQQGSLYVLGSTEKGIEVQFVKAP